MAHQLMLPTAALLSLIGAGLGVHLGNSAIDSINPAYFDADKPRSRFYADLTPQGGPDWGAVHKAELRAAESGLPLAPACVGCRTYPEEYYPVHETSLDKPAIGWAEMAEPVPDTAAEIEAAEVNPQAEAVERYAYFPVEAPEEQQPAIEGAAIAYAASAEPASD